MAHVPLFSQSVPYEHIYQWDIPDYINEGNRYNEQEALDAEEEIWHSLRLTNTSNVPWTTAPGETTKEGMILGQDTLKYTPREGQSTLRITRAIGIKGEQVELETDRKRNAMHWRGHDYDLVTLQGGLSVVNTMAKPVKLEITKTFWGQAKSVSPDAKEEKLARGLRSVNAQTKLTWTINLPAGGTATLSYIRETYI